MSQVNWLVTSMNFPCEVGIQIRYNSPVVSAEIKKINNGYEITFQKPQSAITPGQSIVFYDNDVVLGGGVIEKNTD